MRHAPSLEFTALREKSGRWGAASPTTCFIADACDVNDDGSIDIADPVWLFEWLFKGGPAPAEPFPVMGLDPTADGLDA